MRWFPTPPTILLAFCIGLAAAQPVTAQISPFRGSFANGMTNDDFKMLIDASNDLLSREVLAVGASEGWRNPRSGSSGTITVARDFKHGGYACHALAYEATPRSSGASRNTTLEWCKTKAGWKIL